MGGRVWYDADDMQIAVQWVDRTDDDSERCTFELWEPGAAESAATLSFNSSELRKMIVEMRSRFLVRAAVRVVVREKRAAATAADASRRGNPAVVRRALLSICDRCSPYGCEVDYPSVAGRGTLCTG
jgi:hypothetical protein